MRIDMEQLLQQALSPDEEPDVRLEQTILHTAKEMESMKRNKRRFSVAAAVMIATLLTASLGVYAGWKFLAPEQVALHFADEALSKAFQTEDAIVVNETQELAGYRITLLGIVSGEGLREYTTWDEQGNIVEDRTYVVTAIENADGTPRPDVSEDAYGEDAFYVSPYIKGLSMADYNAHTLRGGYSEAIMDGIQYRIMECDNVEMFAGRGLYLGVNDGAFYKKDAFVMDESTGEIARSEAYTGVNALFELPIPAEKGDEAAVESYLKEKEAELSGGFQEAEPQDADPSQKEEMSFVERLSEEIKAWTLEDYEANGTCVHEEVLTPDENGYISYDYSVGDGGGSEAAVLVSYLFPEGQPGLSPCSTLFGQEPTHVETFELQTDGTIVLRVFEI